MSQRRIVRSPDADASSVPSGLSVPKKKKSSAVDDGELHDSTQ